MSYTDNPINLGNRNGDFSVLVSFAIIDNYFFVMSLQVTHLREGAAVACLSGVTSDLATGSKMLILWRTPDRSKGQWVYGSINFISRFWSTEIRM